MSIIFKPNGSLDVATDPNDLPAEVVGKDTVSFAMQRCKNLRLDTIGVAKTRHGSQKLNTTQIDGTPEFVFINNDYRYIFTTGGLIYADETVLIGGQCATPTFSPDDGAYTATQTVTISVTTLGVKIYYTTDGSTPSNKSLEYSGPINVPLFTQLKAIAIRDGFVDSEIKAAYYTATDANIVTETDVDTLITETDLNNIVNEGVA